jgi:hypothetical protein
MKNTIVSASLFLTLLVILGFAPRSAHAMTISPPDFNITASPGDSIRDVLHVYNEDPYPVTLKPSLLNFTFSPNDEVSGSPEFYAAGEIRNGHELADWIVIEDDKAFTIGSGERVNIPFTITVPKDAQPGGHFGAIHIGTLQESQKEDGPQIGVKASTSALLFVRVNGDTRDELAVNSFFSNSRLYTRLPADFTIRLSNGGTTHLIPVGNIFITNTFGRQVASLEVNGSDKRRVLPGSIRRFEESWMHRRLPKSASEFVQEWRNFAFGKYTATLVINYGDGGAQKLVSSTTSFWVIPWMILAAFATVVLLLSLALRWVMRRYEHAVIERYESKKHQAKV